MSSSYILQKVNLYQCEKGFMTGKRNFDYHYLLYVHKGRGIYQIGSKKYQAFAGDIFYCPPYTDNIIAADEQDPFLLSGIEFNSIEKISEHMKRKTNILTQSFLIGCINEMIDEFTYQKLYSSEIGDNLVAVLIKMLLRISKTISVSMGDIPAALLEYIITNIHRNVTHKELSQVFSYHKNSINRFLKSATGLSLKNYQIDQRIKKASDLLAYSNMEIGLIAEVCGYSSTAFFSRQFKEKTGLSPLKHRLCFSP
jgi:AraC-like DNA-binding protein